MGGYAQVISESKILGVDFLILVALGTQDKKFTRLLKMIDLEIDKKNIKDEVIVQAGATSDYTSKNMKIFSIIPIDEFNDLLKKCDILITHGGVGTIMQALKLGKKVIAIPRLKKYKEHTNDHQLQITNKFTKDGYILTCNSEEEFENVLKKIKEFIPKEFISNNKKFVSNLKSTIDSYK